MDYKKPKTRSESKGNKKHKDNVYNSKTIRQKEAILEKLKIN